MNFLERSVFLRTLNYVRISHGYTKRFNLFIPLAITLLVLLPISLIVPDPNVFGKEGLLVGFQQLLAVLSPFYIASLAAVATFAGPTVLDQEFSMGEPLEIEFLEKGKLRPRKLTLRQFLSMLFGYCSVVSLTLFLFTLFVPVIVPAFNALSDHARELVATAVLGSFLFMFFHMITATLLGVYYLSDKLHRPDPE